MHPIHGNVDMVQFLSTWLPFHSLASPPVRSQSWGCAILSRHPFVAAAPSWKLPSPAGEIPCFQHAGISVGGRLIHLINAHFGDVESDISLQAESAAAAVKGIRPSWNLPHKSAASRLSEHGDEAGNRQEEQQTPYVIFGGDFNSAPLSDAYNTLTASGLVDSRVQVYGPWNGTSDRDPGAGLVFVSDNALINVTGWQEPQYDQQRTSDGYPIVVDVTLPAAINAC